MRILVLGLWLLAAAAPHNLPAAGVLAQAGSPRLARASRRPAAGAAQGRTVGRRNHVFCDYPGSARRSGREFNFASVLEAKQFVERVLRAVGVNRNVIRIEETDDENVNAKAGISDGRLFIYYNPTFIDWIVRMAGTERAAEFIMAHEVGHLQAGHPFEDDGSNPGEEQEIRYRQESDADSYAGFHLRRMGATLDETMAAVNVYAEERGTDKHPPKRNRLAAVRTGWEQADREIRNLVTAEVPRVPAPRAPAPRAPSAPAPRTATPPAPQSNVRPAPAAAAPPIRVHNTSRLLAQDRWTWTVYLEAPPEVLAQIGCVEYHLHHTFTPPVVSVCERGAGRPFAMRSEGWGTFTIRVRVIMKNNRPYDLNHKLILQ